MRVFGKTILAVAFGVVLIEILVLIYSRTGLKPGIFSLIGLTGAAAGLYYFIFERKRKK